MRIKDEYLEQVLTGRAVLLQDGAMGTMLQAAGLARAGAMPELLNFTHAEQISAIHTAYVEAGAQMVTTNTFGANARKLAGAASVEDVFAAAVGCARKSGARYVAADIGPIGELLEPFGQLSFECAYELFATQARAAAAAGADIIAIETMSDLREAKAALLAAKDACDLPVFVTMTFEADGRTFQGTPPSIATSLLSAMGAAAVGINCSLAPADMAPLIPAIVAASRVPVIMRANAGLPRVTAGRTVYGVAPGEYAAEVAKVVRVGVSIVGGCCGTTPKYIAAIKSALQEAGILNGEGGVDGSRECVFGLYSQSANSPSPGGDGAAKPCPTFPTLPASADGGHYVPAFCVSSDTRAVVLAPGSADVAIIGERINPTGKPELKRALLAGNMDYIVARAIEQRDAGADMLDVNVGVPGIDEADMLSRAVSRLQTAVSMPLVIDSANPAAIEAAVRAYGGRPLINSVNGKAQNLADILPIVARYGCSVIGLTLDEAGIPKTAEGRFAIAARIVDAALAHGIAREDIAIDCLTMSAATNQPEAHEILRAIGMVKSELGVRCVLGTSNISFGLPARASLNATFLAAAFGAGLDAAIINPNNPDYARTVAAYKVINNQDEKCENYIKLHTRKAQGEGGAQGECDRQGDGLFARSKDAPSTSTAPSPSPSPSPYSEISRLVIAGRGEAVADVVSDALADYSAMEIIDGALIPALDEVGMRFESGEFFLPQLLGAAEAASAGFDVISGALGDATCVQANKKIVLATVEGDIHDIGKNIVAMLLKNYGYNVIDLGRDVPADKIARAVRDTNSPLVGLSALMTTTVKSMERTINVLRKQAPEAKIMVGGAVLTPDFASQIGADFYAKDATASARIAADVFANCN